MHRINYIQTNIQHICNIGHWYSEKTKERRTTGRKPQRICYRGYQKKIKRNLTEREQRNK
mgnify:CR=1 FL=1